MLQVGAARLSIDPPLPVDPQGYVRRAVSAIAHGDPLLVTAVVFETPDCTAAVIAADLAGQDHHMANAMRDAVASTIPVSAANVMVNASHSHAAPWARVDGAKLGGGHDHFTDAELA